MKNQTVIDPDSAKRGRLCDKSIVLLTGQAKRNAA